MSTSFNGSMVPYYWHCPKAYRLRNVDRVKLPPVEDPEIETKRKEGIAKHDAARDWLVGRPSSFEPGAKFLERYGAMPKEDWQEIDNGWMGPSYRADDTVCRSEVEHPHFYRPDGTPCDPRGDYVMVRPDMFTWCENTGQGEVPDWKFANPNYGAPKHYQEVEFFISFLAYEYELIEEWTSLIWFPDEKDYRLPQRVYTREKVSELQDKIGSRLLQIELDNNYDPIPAEYRCRFCPYRGWESGGSNHCDESAL